MRNIFLSIATITAVMILVTGCADKQPNKVDTQLSKKTHHWNYTGETGPLYWGGLKPEYEMCSKGKNQSPIDMSNYRKVEMKHIELRYFIGGEKVLFNGHAIQVNNKKGSIATIDNITYTLKKIDFHIPSEHTIDGKQYPMEAQLVHQNKKGKLAVIGLMFEEGTENPELAKIIAQLPTKVGETITLQDPVNASALLPFDLDYYRYNGSLTTPPCTEGVVWTIFKKTVPASKAQIETFARVLGGANNRPIQPINARMVER